MMLVYKQGHLVEMRDVSTISASILHRIRIALEACGTYTVKYV